MGKNILYFIPSLNRGQGGVFQYSMRVLDGLLDSEHNIYIYNHSETTYLENKIHRFENARIVNDHSSSPLRKITAKIKRISTLLHQELRFFPRFEDLTINKKTLSKFKIDIIHSPTQSYPINRIPFIFTLHDVQELHMPENFTPLERESRARNNRIGCERARRIIVSYDHVKDDLIKFYKVPPDKIDVVFIGSSDRSLVPRNNSHDSLLKFILYPAATWPHKNHRNLLRAFKESLSENPEMLKFKLVFTGRKTEHFLKLRSLIESLDLTSFVEFLGVVTDQKLKDLYKKCWAVVVPTKYEAGSFPLMEAIAQSVPVICSNVTSLPNTIENQDFTFDPDNISEITEKLVSICASDEFRLKNINNSNRIRNRIMNVDLTKSFNEVYSKIL